MADKSAELEKQEALDLTTDFLGEDRHEFVAKVAYELWEKRGRPIGSPDVDWFAAERAVYSSMLASGLMVSSPNDPQGNTTKIYA